MVILEVRKLTMRFGGLVAVSDVSFKQTQGEILAVIGPNGAGKTSLFNVITGLYAATSGKIHFAGKDLIHHPTLIQKLLALISALVFALVFMLAINAQELWNSAIISRYVYQEPFSYKDSLFAAWQYVLALDLSWNLFPFLAALLFAISALHKFKKAAENTPLVAARAGLARTFQNLRLMGEASVAENIRSVIFGPKRPGLFASIFNLPSVKRYEKFVDSEVDSVLNRLDLSEFADLRADSLAYGLQRRLEIARALATKPKVLLLDEPAAGLNPSESQQLLDLVKEISSSGVTVLLIEHDMSVVMALSDRIIVLQHGEKIAEGTPEQVRQNPAVIKAYLGSAAEV